MRRKQALIILIVGVSCFFGLLVLKYKGPFAYTELQNLYFDTLAQAGRTTPMNPNLIFLAIDADSVNLDEDVDVQQMYGLQGQEFPKRGRCG